MYKTLNISKEFDLNNQQRKTFEDIAHDLKQIKSQVPFLEDIIARSGFIVDTLYKVEPHDIDTFYTTKEQIGTTFSKCNCDEIRNLIKNCDFRLMDKKYELDLGHSGVGELYIPAVEKMTGFFSHLWEVANMVCLDSNGELWSNEEAVHCIKNRIHEIRFDGWLYFPYFINEFPHNDYYFYYTANILRGLRTIYFKKYNGIGPNFKLLLENAKVVVDYSSQIPQYIKELRKYYSKKCYNMSKQDIESALEVTKVNNQKYLLDKFNEMLFD